jgi:hypothetical protein
LGPRDLIVDDPDRFGPERLFTRLRTVLEETAR